MRNVVKWMSRISLGILLMLPVAVFASNEPTVEEDKNSFFANGTPIVVSAREDDVAGAKITWDGGELLVESSISIFGGGHHTDTVYETTNVTMNGGQVRNIFGGGLHKSYVKTANITVNGGTIININGGGASSFSNTTCHQPWFAGNAVADAPTRVDVVNITINGVNAEQTKTSSLFGGGEGISYTGTTNVVINDGDWDYVIAGGSNGYTGDATVKVNGGTIGVLQSVNRGSMDSANMMITGGSVTNAYAGGESTDKNVTGTIKAINMSVTGGEVENLLVGSNGGSTVSAKDVANVEYVTGSVANVDEATFNTDAIVANVKLTFNVNGYEETIIIPKGSTLTEEEINELKNLAQEGYKVVGYYTSADFSTEFDLTASFNTDTTIFIKLEEIKEEEIVNPDTSDMNLGSTIALMGISILGLGYVLKSKKVNA